MTVYVPYDRDGLHGCQRSSPMSKPLLAARISGLLLAGLAAAAGADTGEIAAAREHGASLAAELRASAEPRDWALAADVSGSDNAFPADRADLLAKAAAAAPDDAFVQWLALSNLKAPDAARPDPADRARRLAQSDPGNAAAWMPSLGLAVEARDAARIDATLGRMAAAARFDEHFADYLVAWLDIYARRADRIGESEALVQAMGRAAAFSLPAYKPAMDACDPAKHDDDTDARRDACERLGRLMSAGDVIVTQVLGHALLRKLDRATADDEERERLLRWPTKSAGAIVDEERVLDDMRRTMADWRETGNEAEVFRRRLLGMGGELTPPPGWDWREKKR